MENENNQVAAQQMENVLTQGSIARGPDRSESGTGVVINGGDYAGILHSHSFNGMRTDFQVTGQDSVRPPNKIRELSIKQLNYGFIVTVGCHQFAIGSYKKVAKMIGKYLANPEEIERKWFANELKGLKSNKND